MYLKAFTHLLDDVGHTVPVGQFDVVSSVHQALVSLQRSVQSPESAAVKTPQIPK